MERDFIRGISYCGWHSGNSRLSRGAQNNLGLISEVLSLVDGS